MRFYIVNHHMHEHVVMKRILKCIFLFFTHVYHQRLMLLCECQIGNLFSVNKKEENSDVKY